MIEFDGVTYTYPGAEVPAVADLTFALASGEWLAVVGANGSGKSTLARLVNGLLVPASGHVTVDGMDTADGALVWDVRRRVGLVLQNPDNQIVGAFVEEDVAFGPENLGVPRAELRERVDASLAVVGLTGLEHREPHLLSEGQKQRLAIAGALAMCPAYLVFDEATAMLDLDGRASVLGVMEQLHGSGTGVLQVTHDLADALRADRVLALSGGRVAYLGPLAGLLADADLLEALGLAAPALFVMATELGMSAAPGALLVSAEDLVEALWRS
jgi:energy-coupling factor transport system ATP-binding protein